MAASSSSHLHADFFARFRLYPNPWLDVHVKNRKFRKYVFRILYLLQEISGEKKRVLHSKIARQVNTELSRNKGVMKQDNLLFGESFSERERLAFYQLIQTYPEERTENETMQLCSFLERISFFADMEHSLVVSCCKQVTLEIYAENQTIFYQGDVADVLYVVISGTVDVKIRKPMGTYAAAKLFPGEKFGDFGLASDELVQLRFATTVASDDQTQLLAIPASLYYYLKPVLEERAKQCAVFLKNLKLPVFEKLSEQSLFRLGSMMHAKKFSRLSPIVLQGKRYHHLYFIKRGSVQLVKSVNIPEIIFDALKKTNYKFGAHSELFSTRNNINCSPDNYTVCLDIGSLNAGDFFGTFSSDMGLSDISPFSVVCQAETVVILISVEEILNSLVESEAFSEKLKRLQSTQKSKDHSEIKNPDFNLELLCSNNPKLMSVMAYLKAQNVTSNECIQTLSRKIEWEAYKTNMSMNIRIDRLNLKNSREILENVPDNRFAPTPVVPNHVLKILNENQEFEFGLTNGTIPTTSLQKPKNNILKTLVKSKSTPIIKRSLKFGDDFDTERKRNSIIQQENHVNPSIHHSILSRSLLLGKSEASSNVDTLQGAKHYAHTVAADINKMIKSSSASCLRKKSNTVTQDSQIGTGQYVKNNNNLGNSNANNIGKLGLSGSQSIKLSKSNEVFNSSVSTSKLITSERDQMLEDMSKEFADMELTLETSFSSNLLKGRDYRAKTHMPLTTRSFISLAPPISVIKSSENSKVSKVKKTEMRSFVQKPLKKPSSLKLFSALESSKGAIY